MQHRRLNDVNIVEVSHINTHVCPQWEYKVSVPNCDPDAAVSIVHIGVIIPCFPRTVIPPLPQYTSLALSNHPSRRVLTAVSPCPPRRPQLFPSSLPLTSPHPGLPLEGEGYWATTTLPGLSGGVTFNVTSIFSPAFIHLGPIPSQELSYERFIALANSLLVFAWSGRQTTNSLLSI